MMCLWGNVNAPKANGFHFIVFRSIVSALNSIPPNAYPQAGKINGV